MNALTINTPKIKIHGTVLETTSLNVAQVFGRRHKDVIRKIDNLDCSTGFHERNFTPMQKTVVTNNKGTKVIPTFDITRDGFTFLAMGFTGKKAAQFKEAYIEAFNTMENELLQNNQQHALLATISPAQQRTIQEAVAALSKDDGSYAKHYGNLKTQFRVGTYKDITIDKFEEAMSYLVGEYVPEKKQAAIPDDMVLVNRENLQALISLSEKSAEVYNNRIQELEIMMTDASIKMVEFRSRTWDAVRDGAWVAKTLKKYLN